MKQKKKVYLAFALIPAAALLLPGFAADTARAAETINTDGSRTYTGAANTISGPQTITVNATGTSVKAVDATPTAGTTLTLDGTTGPISVTNHATGNNSIGVNLSNAAGNTGDLSLIMKGNNSVTTDHGTSILVNNFATAANGGAANITISGTINVISNDTAAGAGDDGVEATTHNGGTAKIDMSQANGTITVKGGGNGILIESVNTPSGSTGGGNVIGNIGSGITINITNPTAASAYNGIQAFTQGLGTVKLETGATIKASGPNTNGILAYAVRGTVDVTNTGAITTDGATSFGIDAYTTANANPAGDVSVVNSGIIKSGTGAMGDSNDASGGINAHSTTAAAGNTGAVSVTNTGDITVFGAGSEGIQAYTSSTGAGKASGVTVVNGSATQSDTITTSGDNAYGIFAQSKSTGAGAASDVSVTSTGGAINTSGDQATGIFAQSTAATSGKVSVTNSSAIHTAGASKSAGIYAESLGLTGTVSVTNHGAIITTGTGTGNYGIFAGAAAGDAEVDNSGDIATDGVSDHAILAATADGAVSVTNSGKLTTSGDSANGIQATTTDGKIDVINNSGGDILAKGAGANGIEADTDSGAITITNNANVTSQQAVGVLATATGMTNDTSFMLTNQANGNISGAAAGVRLSDNFTSAAIDNAGSIGSANDLAIDTSALTTAPVAITNTGAINGYMTLGSADGNTLTNQANGIWNLRNYNSATNTLAVAVANFGAGNNNTITNNGTIALLGAADAANLDASGAYATGYDANTMALGGPVQGALLGLVSFTNNGTIDMTANSAVGDVLFISGDYISGGTLKLDTVWNAGGNAGSGDSQSDMLVIGGGTKMGNGPTIIDIVGAGDGALTTGDGIELVRVLNNGGTGIGSDPGVFQFAGRVVNGLYEYDLYQGGLTNPNDGNWYLRSMLTNSGDPALRPEPSVYVRNMAAAGGMFIHTLHDRLGEPQYTETYGGNGKDKNNDVPAVWGRVIGSRTDTETNGGSITTKTDSGLVHLGGDIAHWTDGHSRYHLGVMGAYGRSDTDAEADDILYTNNGIRRKASGDVEGYALGVYGTWYGNDKYPAGPYVDVWGMLNWFDNTVQGNELAKETYKSKGGIVSVEAGYAFIARDDGKRQWMLEPQVQVAYAILNQDSHEEVNGTRVNNDDGDGVIARVGVRMYSRSTRGDNGIQPFVEANVWHYSMNNSLDFNGVTMSDGAPSARYEFKAGLQGELAKHWQMWGHVGGQWGLDGYDRYEGMVGLKYVF